jgi:hypothetical protein
MNTQIVGYRLCKLWMCISRQKDNFPRHSCFSQEGIRFWCCEYHFFVSKHKWSKQILPASNLYSFLQSEIIASLLNWYQLWFICFFWKLNRSELTTLFWLKNYLSKIETI